MVPCHFGSVISLSLWQELYDTISNDIVQTTLNTALNGKLYAKLLVSLEGQALQCIISQKHLQARNGLLLLCELTQAYKLKNVPEVIADWPTLLVLCQDYYHLINPQGILNCDSHKEHSSRSQAE